jgi:hypothetical protein
MTPIETPAATPALCAFALAALLAGMSCEQSSPVYPALHLQVPVPEFVPLPSHVPPIESHGLQDEQD